MSYSNTAEAIENLAASIGENVYIDVAKWHLYLGDAHLHTPLAERFYPILVEDDLSAAKVTEVLKSMPVKLGGGRSTVTLLELLPTSGEQTLLNVLEDYQRQM